MALSWPGDVPWQVGRLLEGVLLARMGTERYREALESGFDTATVERAVGTVMDLTAFGRSDRDPGPTVESLLDGRVAMVAAGGRLVGGAASTSGLAARPDAAYGDDWAVTPFPGTAGTVQFGATAFGAPVEAPTPERSERWLRFVGSTPAQRRFSVAAGSFPLRTDATRPPSRRRRPTSTTPTEPPRPVFPRSRTGSSSRRTRTSGTSERCSGSTTRTARTRYWRH
ncbi:hypothetical protein GJ629_03095 [Halapricum sp. CBA1109]|uniref:extracellular solute-binding protein n=1 Tax=Halapricum sp. CBA1109 TaxID=2668068 RepID=UPI0012FC680F|nr:extracellular solute-binding protein [Halapricum sp. CBA1109]MUV89003.1 hypothetical protein [Halapricum sp. CBA1109]